MRRLGTGPKYHVWYIQSSDRVWREEGGYYYEDLEPYLSAPPEEEAPF